MPNNLRSRLHVVHRIDVTNVHPSLVGRRACVSVFENVHPEKKDIKAISVLEEQNAPVKNNHHRRTISTCERRNLNGFKR